MHEAIIFIALGAHFAGAALVLTRVPRKPPPQTFLWVAFPFFVWFGVQMMTMPFSSASFSWLLFIPTLALVGWGAAWSSKVAHFLVLAAPVLAAWLNQL